jgi:hypothetical protein
MKGVVACLSGLLCAGLGSPGHTAPGLETVKVFRGHESDRGVTVKLVRLKPREKKQALIEVTGTGQALDGKVLLYRVDRTGINRARARARVRYCLPGLNRCRLVGDGRTLLVRGSLRPYLEVYLRGRKIKVLYSASDSHQAEGPKLLKRYLRAQRHDVSSQTAIARSLSTAVAAMRRRCGSAAFNAEIKWATFRQRRAAHVAQSAVNYIEALSALCADKDYRSAIKSFTRAVFSLSSRPDSHAITRERRVLRIALAAEMPNNFIMAKHWFKENL